MIFDAFDYLSAYIGGAGATFLSIMVFLVILRVGIFFIFSIFRMDLKYHSMQSNINRWAKEEDMKNSKLK